MFARTARHGSRRWSQRESETVRGGGETHVGGRNVVCEAASVSVLTPWIFPPHPAVCLTEARLSLRLTTVPPRHAQRRLRRSPAHGKGITTG